MVNFRMIAGNGLVRKYIIDRLSSVKRAHLIELGRQSATDTEKMLLNEDDFALHGLLGMSDEERDDFLAEVEPIEAKKMSAPSSPQPTFGELYKKSPEEQRKILEEEESIDRALDRTRDSAFPNDVVESLPPRITTLEEANQYVDALERASLARQIVARQENRKRAGTGIVRQIVSLAQPTQDESPQPEPTRWSQPKPRRKIVKVDLNCAECGTHISELPEGLDLSRPIYCQDCWEKRRKGPRATPVGKASDEAIQQKDTEIRQKDEEIIRLRDELAAKDGGKKLSKKERRQREREQREQEDST